MEKINYLAVFVLIIVSLSACDSTKTIKQTKVISQEHQVLSSIWFNESAEMQASFIQNYNLAKLLIDKHINSKEKAIKPPAVVLDLDETVLDNGPYQYKLIVTKKEFTSKSWTEWVKLAKAKALPGALDFVNYAKDNGFEIFYISNRKAPEHLDATIKNLQNLQFHNANKEHVLLKTKTGDKTERRAIVSEKYEIILFIGDNLTDFSEVFANRGNDMGKNIVEKNKALFGTKYIIMPNPMYGEWIDAVNKNSYEWSAKQFDSLRKAVIKPNY